MKLPRILIIYTGGTFGMDERSGRALTTPALKPAALAKRMRERVPELESLAHCDVEILLNRDSAHVGPGEWKLFAEVIQSRWSKYDGVVLLHGTDTMAYTASALSFLLRPCLKPVILTGAQRPLSVLRTDARRNLISAVEIAAHGPRKLVNRVSIFFDRYLLQGNRARKRSASEFFAFDTPQWPALATVGTGISYSMGVVDQPRTKSRAKSRTGAFHSSPEFSRKVACLAVTPGFPARVIRERLLNDVEGLVLTVFPSGTAPTHDPDFIELMKEARKRHLPVVIATEGYNESGLGSEAHPNVYAAGQLLLREGGHWAGTMTPECAFVKTAWILGQKDGAKNFAHWWKQDFAGEGV